MATENELDIRSIVMSMVDRNSTGSQIKLSAGDVTILVEITILSMQKGERKETYGEAHGDYPDPLLAVKNPVADAVKDALDV